MKQLKKLWWALTTRIRERDWDSIRKIQVKAAIGLLDILFLPIGLIFTIIIRMIRPWFLVRIKILTSDRLGHLAGNPEIYLCELDAGKNTPEKPYVDLWYHNWPVANKQLARMWKRVLHIGPRWLLAPLRRVNSFIPGGGVHIIGEPSRDRDLHNLIDLTPPHLSFLAEEKDRGEAGLRALGIPAGTPFVCLNVRDSGYLIKSLPWNYYDDDNYRDCNIQNYVLAAQELAKRGYYVIRTGAVVNEAMNVTHPMIIDYAAKGMRSDFMDIYLGANCGFCISNGTGFDAVPYIFRRPIVYVDHVPLGIIATFSSRFLATTKKHWLRDEGRFMTFREIFESGAGLGLYSREDGLVFGLPCKEGGLEIGIDLIESTPNEIAAVVLEMESRLKGTWQTTKEDEELQRRFWEIFPRSKLHGDIRSRIGADFLRQNKAWLE